MESVSSSQLESQSSLSDISVQLSHIRRGRRPRLEVQQDPPLQSNFRDRERQQQQDNIVNGGITEMTEAPHRNFQFNVTQNWEQLYRGTEE